MTNVSPQQFECQFGFCSPEAPFGDRLWEGMRAHLRAYYARGGRGSPSAYGAHFRAGWFLCPEPFGREAAALSVEQGGSSGIWYPAVFTMGYHTQETISMWCLHILVMRTRVWHVHVSRVRIVAGYEEYLNVELTGPQQ